MVYKSVSTKTLQRLPSYLNYLKALPKNDYINISSKAIANALGLNEVQVRKDLASISHGGRPRTGYITKNLILDIEKFLGYCDSDSAVVVGAGNLGRSLMEYKGFSEYGLDIVAAFDVDERIIGATINGRQVLSAARIKDLCRRMNIRIGIITVPASEAQNVCDALIEGGVLAIWNFAPVHLKVPENVLVHNENMAYSLAVLSKHLREKLLND